MEPVIGGEAATQQEGEAGGAEPVIGGNGGNGGTTPAAPAPEGALAELLREALLAAHDDLAREDLAGESAADVRERFLAARARLTELAREAREAEAAAIPAGAPGRLVTAPATPLEKIRQGLSQRATGFAN